MQHTQVDVTQISDDQFVTVTAVAQFLKVSSESVRDYERKGKLKALKTASGIRLFKLRDVKTFARTRLEKARR